MPKTLKLSLTLLFFSPTSKLRANLLVPPSKYSRIHHFLSPPLLPYSKPSPRFLQSSNQTAYFLLLTPTCLSSQIHHSDFFNVSHLRSLLKIFQEIHISFRIKATAFQDPPDLHELVLSLSELPPTTLPWLALLQESSLLHPIHLGKHKIASGLLALLFPWLGAIFLQVHSLPLLTSLLK